MEKARGACYDIFRGNADHDCDCCDYRMKHRFLYINIEVECYSFREKGGSVACRIPCVECRYAEKSREEKA